MHATDTLPPIHGFIPTSLCDWDGCISQVLFLPGCNFACPYCHNAELARGGGEPLPFAEIERLAKRQKGWVEGTVITGGEPTLHAGLSELCRRLKAQGHRIKLDTNGSFPERLAALLKEEVIDFVALDIKGGWATYERACGTPGMGERVRESARLLLGGRLPYEFRTTAVPGLITGDDFSALGRALPHARQWAIQQYRPGATLNPAYAAITPFTLEQLRSFAQCLEQSGCTVTLRNVSG